MGYTARMDVDIEEILEDDKTCNFWPELFELDKGKTVKIRVHDIGPAEGEDLSESQRRAREYVEAEEDRIDKMLSYASPLDRAAMALTFDQLKAFTAHYAQYNNALRAAKYANGSLVAFKRRRKIDHVFADMWDLAREYWIDRLESVGMDRATMDIKDPMQLNASNDMLKFMLKANSEKHQETIKVKHEGAAPAVNVNMQNLDADEQKNLRLVARKMLQGGK